MKYGSLFSGIGGMDLGLDRAGMQCRWQVEIDDYATKVLEKHWPDVPKFRDVRECGKHNLEAVDLIAGGFPCQDISSAGKRMGINGERSGLWTEFYRIVCELRPRFVLVENVTDLLNRGMGRVLGDLVSCGFDAEWQCLPAAAFGAPHIRDRVFIFAYTSGDGRRRRDEKTGRAPRAFIEGSRTNGNTIMANTDSKSTIWTSKPRTECNYWTTEPAVGRVANGVPRRVDRLRGLGNAVVPQVAEWIGKRIIEADAL